MHNYHLVTLSLIFLIIFMFISCKPDGSSKPLPSTTHTDMENKESSTEVIIGGKTWKINPNLSYRAVGIWTNPNPRPLTDEESQRLKEIQTNMQTLRSQLNELDKEMNFLKRIEKTEIKFRYTFGRPPHLSSGKIHDLGEFSMEMENPTDMPTHLE